jgi:hypothetical protein
MRKSLIRTISKLELELKNLEKERHIYKSILGENDNNAHNSGHSSNGSYIGSSSSGGSAYKQKDNNTASKLASTKKIEYISEEEEEDYYSYCDSDISYSDASEDEKKSPRPKINKLQKSNDGRAKYKQATIEDESDIEKVVFVQKYVRRWLAKRRYLELLEFYGERARVIKELIKNENAYVVNMRNLCTYFVSVLSEAYKQESFIQTLFRTLEAISMAHAAWLKKLQSQATIYNIRLEIAEALGELVW